MVPTLPSGTLVYQLCGAQCKEACTTARDACSLPAASTAEALGAYFQCLVSRCQDAGETVISGLTGGKVPYCGGVYGLVESMGGNCSFDLSAVAPTLPKGTLLHHICRKQCKELCPKAEGASTVSADVEKYAKCLKKSCRDAHSTFLKNLTGDFM